MKSWCVKVRWPLPFHEVCTEFKKILSYVGGLVLHASSSDQISIGQSELIS